MLTARVLFIACLLFSVYFFIGHPSTLHISTDLKDLSPNIANNKSQQDIIDAFSNNIQHRFILLIRSKNSALLDQASAKLASELHAIDELKISSENNHAIQSIVNQLKPYRHQLLTPEQKSDLEKSSILEISNKAQERLYQLDSSIRLLPFNEDPLGYLSDYIFYLLAKLSEGNTLENDSKTWRSVSVNITSDNLDMNTQTRLFNTINDIEKDIESNYNVEIFHSGLFFFAAEAAISSKADIEFISTGSTVFIVLILLLVFRSLWPLLLPIISISLGVGFAIAVTHYLYGSLHILTIVFGASLIGIVIDYSLHFFYHHIQNRSASTKRALYSALLLSLLTSMIGYGALGLSDLAALRKIALFSCCGLLMAWLSVVVLGQTMLRGNQYTDKFLLPKLLASISLFIPNNTRVLAGGLLCFFVLCFIVLSFSGFNTDDDPRLFYSVSNKLLNEEKEVSTVLKKYEPGRFFIIEGKNEDIVRTHLTTLREKVKSLNADIFLFSITDLLPNKVLQKQHYMLNEKLYKQEGVISTLYKNLNIDISTFEELQKNYASASDKQINPALLLNLSTDILPTWFETKNGIATIVLIAHGSNTNGLANIVKELADVNYINSVELAAKVLREQRISAIKILCIAFILVAILLLLYYRSTLSLFALLVPASSVLTILVYLSFSQDTVTLFHVMALFLVLGLGMDYVIFSREMSAYRDTTQQAILLSAITTSISFGFLSMSSIPIAQSFGLTILIGNTVNFLGTLVYSHFIHKLDL